MIWPLALSAASALGIPERLRRAAAWIVLALAAVAALAALYGAGTLAWRWWMARHDKAVIEKHEAAISDDVSERTTKALTKAMENDTARQVEAARRDAVLKEAAKDAEDKNPEAVRAGVGPATDAVARKLRDRARQTGPAAN